MIFIIFLLIIVCWIVGGQIKGRVRDVGVPIFLGLGMCLVTKSLFIGTISVGLWQIIRLGYGNYEKGEKNSFLGDLLKDKNGWYVRALYGLIVATIGCLAVRIGHFLPIWAYIAYIAGNTLIGYGVSRFRLPVLLADICISSGFGSILFLV